MQPIPFSPFPFLPFLLSPFRHFLGGNDESLLYLSACWSYEQPIPPPPPSLPRERLARTSVSTAPLKPFGWRPFCFCFLCIYFTLLCFYFNFIKNYAHKLLIEREFISLPMRHQQPIPPPPSLPRERLVRTSVSTAQLIPFGWRPFCFCFLCIYFNLLCFYFTLLYFAFTLTLLKIMHISF